MELKSTLHVRLSLSQMSCITMTTPSGRDESRAAAAMSSIERELAELGLDSVGRMTFLPFNLLDLKSCTEASKTVLTREARLDIIGQWQ